MRRAGVEGDGGVGLAVAPKSKEGGRVPLLGCRGGVSNTEDLANSFGIAS